MQIDPRWPFYIGLVTCIAMILGQAGIWTGAVGDTYAHMVSAWMNIIGTVGTAVMTFLSGYSARKSGPLVG